MSDTLKNFLVDLASDPERMNRYLVDPGREIDGAGLSAADRAALLARDSGALRRMLGASPAHHMTRVVTMDPTLPGESGESGGADESGGAPVKSARRRPATKKKKAATKKTSRKKTSRKKTTARKRKAGSKK